ncbi:MAG: 2-amino-4-hydroxy-6-hydroxymethyldihydropteridine diphosphokinase [Actinomycetota bacterium]|jgi:2-amino-4-hydroxy-6-hydroxymethyldihydropteridine diphosphokinase|nr:2-amino-4-hydroxy-6-hydroxymethyldihydropteridine diphosphokinase [Actinomycetota bacterium]
MTTGYIGIGSNVGDRLSFCRRAVEALRAVPGVSVDATSSLYETSPVGGPPQRSFVNLVAAVETSLTPRELLEACKQIERRLGREPGEIRWGPRVADLDILTLGDEKVNEPDLELPHPRITERRFVLVPLLEIDPQAADPWGARYADFLDEAEGDVKLVEPF